MTSTKPRIYDLARFITSTETDQKAKKQKQSDITKQIISICEELGYPIKSASSSIDESMLSKIVLALQEHGFNLDVDIEKISHEIKEHTQEKKVKTSKSKDIPPVEEEAPQPQKKQLKIVRRIKPPQPPVEEKKEEQVEVKPTQPELNKPIAQPQLVIKTETIAPKPESAVTRKQLEELQKLQTAKPFTPIKQKGQELKPGELSTMQPFRVAKPSVMPSMMGRTKRPSTKTIRPHKEKERQHEFEKAVIVEEKPLIATLTSSLTVKELAERLSLSETEVVKSLFAKGIIRTVNQTVELRVAIECAKSLGYEVITEKEEEEHKYQVDISKENEADLVPRDPVVTIMGHVDHGKTTLLDAIRETKLKITDQESGGITQHIGAYQVEVLDYDGNKRKITFLDTPGHEAFTAMRARGAQVTDIAVLVVAADDGIMPQTIEAIDHARAAKVPIVIALNKIDKPEAQSDRVLGELTHHDLLIEDYGGKTVCSKISAKKRINLDDLLVKITLVADAELSSKLRANPKGLATGAVVEAELNKERGVIADLLILNGTLKKGDCIVVGCIAGRVRAMFDDHGREVAEAPPSMPVAVLGLPDVPNAGDDFMACKTYQEAKEIAQVRKQKEQEKHKAFGLVDFSSKVREGGAQELNVIIKADVHGSAEAVAKEITKLSTSDVVIRIVHLGSGNISESDINLASSTNSIIIGFHVGIDTNAQKIGAERLVDIRLYDIIYKITEDLEKAVLGLLEPEKENILLGVAEVRQIFVFGKGNKIAGCYVIEGKIQRNQIAKVKRGGKIVFEGNIDNLKRFKDDAREVQTGFECGISFKDFNDIEESDKIECWTVIEKERTSL